MYVNDPAHDQKDIDAMRTALKESKGPGNFRNLFLYSPNGKKDGVQVIPVSEVAAKDDFWNIKNITRDDQLAGHRIPPQLMGIIPQNTGGFGDVEKAARVFVANELEPCRPRCARSTSGPARRSCSSTPTRLAATRLRSRSDPALVRRLSSSPIIDALQAAPLGGLFVRPRGQPRLDALYRTSTGCALAWRPEA